MKIVETIEVMAPVERVFSIFSNLGMAEKYIDGITQIEVLEGSKQMAVGTKWKETRVMFGKEASETMEITELEDNKFYKTEAVSHGSEYVTTYTFEPNDKSTMVTMEFTGKPVSFTAKLMTPIGLLFKNATKKAFVADMEALKEVAEKQLVAEK